MTVEEIAAGLTPQQRIDVLAMQPYSAGRAIRYWLGIFPARREGATALGEAVRAALMKGTDNADR